METTHTRTTVTMNRFADYSLPNSVTLCNGLLSDIGSV